MDNYSLIIKIIIPLIGLVINYWHGTLLKDINQYLPYNKEYKRLRQQLKTPFIETINEYLNIRKRFLRNIDNKELAFLVEDNKYTAKEIYNSIDLKIDDFKKPEMIFREFKEWPEEFEKCKENFFRILTSIFKIKQINRYMNISTYTFWIAFYLVIIFSILSIGVNYIMDEYDLLNDFYILNLKLNHLFFNISLIFFIIILTTCILTVLIKKKIDGVYEDAQKYHF